MATSAITTEEETKMHLKRQLITVYIWTSGGNPKVPGQNVGHVAIEIKHPIRLASGQVISYISFWPQDAVPKSKVTSAVPGEFVDSYPLDYAKEERDSEHKFYFYTLNQSNLVEKFIKIKEAMGATGPQWVLFPHGGSNNCASLAWDVLVASGIERLISREEQFSLSSSASATGAAHSSKAGTSSKPKESSKACSYSVEMMLGKIFTSPDLLSVFLTKAKEHELEQQPLTRQLEGRESVRPRP